MSDPVVGIVKLKGVAPLTPAPHAAVLQPLDYRIIHALRKNSRRRVADVAEELGVSAKTVQRRLSRMIGGGLIELSLEWYPDASNDIITLFHLRLKPSADGNKVGSLLVRKYSPNVLFSWHFTNIPNHLICFVWTNTMKELRDIREAIQSEKFFESVSTNILFTGYIFDTWRDRLVEERVASLRKTF